MPLTQESEVNKNYQALGMDEVARDIENIITVVNDLTENGATGYTETIVNISSAQILAMGSSPIELLPAAGAGKYYDIEKIILEYTHVTTGYTGSYFIIKDSDGYLNHGLYNFTQESANTVVVINDIIEYWSIGASPTDFHRGYFILNKSLLLTHNATDPTGGDGTLRVKIYHKTITFGV